MASKAKKLSVMNIRKICASGKELREEVVFERVSGELAETFKVYLDSRASEFESIKRCSSLVLVIKRSSERFFDLFSEKVKFSRDKYAVLQVRWYEYVRELLGSEEVRKIVEDSGKDGDIVRSIVSCYLESLWNVNLQYVMGVQGNGKAKMSEVRQYPCRSEDKVSLLKLGSAAVVSLRKRLRKVLSTMSSRKSTQSVRNILVKQIAAIDVMEDKKKESLPGFIKSLDEGNLFVLKFECIPFLESFSKVFSDVVNHEGYNLLGNKLFKVSIKPFVYQIYIIF